MCHDVPHSKPCHVPLKDSTHTWTYAHVRAIFALRFVFSCTSSLTFFLTCPLSLSHSVPLVFSLSIQVITRASEGAHAQTQGHVQSHGPGPVTAAPAAGLFKTI